ncbi:MAG TPA: hypothetical protein ENJ82_13435 [Bacteroidetes bacterium]|nr:hypothetical protein [Bacteroidota bacterium]
MKKSINLIAFLSLLFLMSCGGGESEVTIGQTFKVKDLDMAIESVSSHAILSDDTRKESLVASPGHTYLKVRLLTNASNHIMTVFTGEKELEEADFMDVMHFVSEDAGPESNYSESFFLIEEGQKIDRIEVRGFGGSATKYILKDVKYEAVSDRTVNPKMFAFMEEFSAPQRLLSIVKKYISQDVYNVVHEAGSDVPVDPMLRNFRINYVNPTGTSYSCYADGLDLVSVDIDWTGDEISSLNFSL